MESELERRVAERTRELQKANEALRQSQQMFAGELDIAQRLQHVATELISARGTQALRSEMLTFARASPTPVLRRCRLESNACAK